MNAFRASFGFLTILPVGPRSGVGLGSARAFFPVVGLALGVALAGFDRLAHNTFGDELTAALIVTGLLAATRMLHIDGLMDSCDALLGGFTRERRLEILKDSRIGVFGAISGVGLVLLKWSALLTLAGPVRLPVIILFPLIARWCSVAVMQTFTYQSKAGIGSVFMENRSAWPTLVAGIIAIAGSLVIGGALGIILMVIATATSLLFAAWMARLLGGLTGDGYGAVVEVAEVAVLISAVALYKHWPNLLDGRIELGF